jgi:flagellar L-ring protein FlgH
MKSGLRALLILIAFLDAGCASWGRSIKDFLDGDSSKEAQAPSTTSDTNYADNPNMAPSVRRQYKRTTKESLQDDAGLDQKAGSLWVMEGQGAYLFAQNVMRLVGDPIGVVIEGEAKEQLTAKADVIRDLLDKIEERSKARQRALAGEADQKEAKPAATDEAQKDKKTAGNETNKEKANDFNVKIVPARIVERTVDGNYRVKGSQPMMIGSRQFKVIVTGVVRAEDFNDEGINASKLLEPKFDLVSAKRTGAEI